MLTWRRLWALEAGLTVAEVLYGAGGQVVTEERYNAMAGLQLACGHAEALWTLQYKAFCGGCSADAVAGAGLFRVFGEGELIWKAVPATWRLVTVGSAGWLAQLLAGPRAALVAVALLVGAPAFWTELSLVGFGNHAEASALVLTAAAVFTAALRAGVATRLVALPLAGALTGAACWYAWSSLYALAALGVAGLLTLRRGGPLAWVGVPLGAWPAWAYHQAMPEAVPATRDWWRTLEVAPIDELVRWLGTDIWTGGLWPAWPWLSVAWWGAVWVGAVLAARRAGPWLPAALVALVAAYALRWDLWHDNHALETYDPFNLRYRAPLIPLLAVAASASRLRPVLLLLALVGLGWRVAGWEERSHAPSVLVADGRPDRTVPAGQPPQRNPRQWGRPQDVAAARTFLAAHDDLLPACRTAHEAELSRRESLR